ncbi:hypothetical protein [Neisseria sp. Ec49-e6-T10]|uniref:hypothetical protein n=1 Tax=Neisseria sp. Ec49-e6-T10 TaxID=3140744 RepID=UPI003EB8ABB2
MNIDLLKQNNWKCNSRMDRNLWRLVYILPAIISILFFLLDGVQISGILFSLSLVYISVSFILILMTFLIARDANCPISIWDVFPSIFFPKEIKVFLDAIEVEGNTILIADVKEVLFLGHRSRFGHDKCYKIIFHKSAAMKNIYIIVRSPDEKHELKQENVFMSMLIKSGKKE